MNKNFILFILLFFVPAMAQSIDTAKINKVVALESTIDSLRQIIRQMDTELQSIKKNMVEGKSNVDELLALLNDEDVESASVDSRSRRKRVDALLKAITQRPGQLRFNGDMTSLIQTIRSNDSTNYIATGSFDIFAHTSFGENTLLFINMEGIGGNGPDEFYSALVPLNADAGSTQDEDGLDRISLLEAWIEFTLWQKRFVVTAGKIDLTNYFDNNAVANDETMQFISGAFVNNSAFIVPSNSPGFRVRTSLYNRIHFQFAMTNVYNSGRNIFKHLYKSGSVAYTFFPGTSFEANLRVFMYFHPLANGRGTGFSMDKQFKGKYNIFARIGNNDHDLASFSGIKKSYSLGTSVFYSVAGKRITMGLAFGQTYSTDELSLNEEQIIELFLRAQINKWTFLTPHLQWIQSVGGSDADLVILSLRTHFNF
ncbi:MAG: carbohydrate porin [Calditrichia bacterium]